MPKVFTTLEESYTSISSVQLPKDMSPSIEVAFRAVYAAGAKHALAMTLPFIPSGVLPVFASDVLTFEDKTIKMAKKIWPNFPANLESFTKQKQSTEKMFDPSKN